MSKARKYDKLVATLRRYERETDPGGATSNEDYKIRWAQNSILRKALRLPRRTA